MTSVGLITARLVWTHRHIILTAKAEYVLLYENYPGGTFLDDGLSHKVVELDGKTSLELKFSDDKKIENITGWYTLYRESQ
jgi:hypothetical protein